MYCFVLTVGHCVDFLRVANNDDIKVNGNCLTLCMLTVGYFWQDCEGSTANGHIEYTASRVTSCLLCVGRPAETS